MKSELIRFPEVFDVFALVLILLGLFILVRLILACLRILKRWSEVTLRHRTFFTFSLYFVITFLVLIICGFNSSYDRSGIMVLVLFPVANIYVLVLQIFWRFSDKGKSEIHEFTNDVKSTKPNLQKPKRRLDYFNDEYEIKLFRKGQLESSEVNFESDNSLMTVEDNSDLIIRPKNDRIQEKPIIIEPKSEAQHHMDSFEKLKHEMPKIDIAPTSITANLKLNKQTNDDIVLIKPAETHQLNISISDEEDKESDKEEKTLENDSQLILFSQADDKEKPPSEYSSN